MSTPITFESYRDIKGYIINLDREQWRYDITRKELINVGFSNLSRWPATDYKKEDVVAEMHTLGATRLERFYNCAEMSCLLSHFRIMHNFLIGTDPYCLIFEDDAIPVPEFKDVCNFSDINYGDVDLLCFGAAYAAPNSALWRPKSVEWNTTNWNPVLEAEKNGSTHVSDCCFWLAHAYMLSRRGAYKLLQDYSAWASSDVYRIPFMDVYMSSNRNIKNKLSIYRKFANPQQYATGDRFGDRFCGIIHQRADFKSTIIGAT